MKKMWDKKQLIDIAEEYGGSSGVATKEYVDNLFNTLNNKKLDKRTDNFAIYGNNYKGVAYPFISSHTPHNEAIARYSNGKLQSNDPQESLEVVNLDYFNNHTIPSERFAVGVAFSSTGLSWKQLMTLKCPNKVALVFFQLTSNTDHATKIVEILDTGIRFNDSTYSFDEGTTRLVLSNWYQSNYLFFWHEDTKSLEVFINKSTSEKRIAGIGI